MKKDRLTPRRKSADGLLSLGDTYSLRKEFLAGKSETNLHNYKPKLLTNLEKEF